VARPHIGLTSPELGIYGAEMCTGMSEDRYIHMASVHPNFLSLQLSFSHQTSTMTQNALDAPLPSRPTLFVNANLVGVGEGPYSVLVDGGKIVSIQRGEVGAEGADVVDLQQADGSRQWLSPVSFEIVTPLTRFSPSLTGTRTTR